MPTRPPRVCPGCGDAVTGRCPTCTRTTRAATDTQRGTAVQRGYGRHHRRFRAGVLARDPLCRCTDPACPTHPRRPSCARLSTVADHHPSTRRELVAQGADPDDPDHGRGLCAPCHNHATATDPRTLGGWNRDRTG